MPHAWGADQPSGKPYLGEGFFEHRGLSLLIPDPEGHLEPRPLVLTSGRLPDIIVGTCVKCRVLAFSYRGSDSVLILGRRAGHLHFEQAH